MREVAQHRGSANLRAALREARSGVRSVAEGDARRLILGHDLPEPEWNVDLYAADGTFLGCVDGYWRHVAVAWEIDSREWHLSPADWEATMARHMRLTAAGVIMVHTPPSRVRREAASVLADLRGTLEMAHGRPLPPIIAVPRG